MSIIQTIQGAAAAPVLFALKYKKTTATLALAATAIAVVYYNKETLLTDKTVAKIEECASYAKGKLFDGFSVAQEKTTQGLSVAKEKTIQGLAFAQVKAGEGLAFANQTAFEVGSYLQSSAAAALAKINSLRS